MNPWKRLSREYAAASGSFACGAMPAEATRWMKPL